MVSAYRLLFGILLAGILALAACGDDEEGGGEDTSEFAGSIKIGALLDYTGAGALIAPSLERGLTVAMEEINDDGGVKVGGKAYQFELITQDSRSDPVATVAGAVGLADQGVIAANVATTVDPAAYEQLRSRNIIMFGASPPVKVRMVTEGAQNHPFFFATNNDNREIVLGHLKMIIGLYPDITRIGFMGDDSVLATTLSAGVALSAERLGKEFVGREAAPFGTTDWATYATNMKARNPQLVIVSASAAFVEATRTALQLDVAPYFLTWLMSPRSVDLLGDLGNKAIFGPDWRIPLFPEEGVVPPKYEDKADAFGELPGEAVLHMGWAQTNYNFMYLLKQAMEKAQTVTDTLAISQAFEGLQFEGPFGTVTERNHLNYGPTGFLAATRDEYKIFTFAEYPTADKNVPVDVEYTKKRK